MPNESRELDRQLAELPEEPPREAMEPQLKVKHKQKKHKRANVKIVPPEGQPSTKYTLVTHKRRQKHTQAASSVPTGTTASRGDRSRQVRSPSPSRSAAPRARAVRSPSQGEWDELVARRTAQPKLTPRPPDVLPRHSCRRSRSVRQSPPRQSPTRHSPRVASRSSSAPRQRRQPTLKAKSRSPARQEPRAIRAASRSLSPAGRAQKALAWDIAMDDQRRAEEHRPRQQYKPPPWQHHHMSSSSGSMASGQGKSKWWSSRESSSWHPPQQDSGSSQKLLPWKDTPKRWMHATGTSARVDRLLSSLTTNSPSPKARSQSPSPSK